jgi:hypothetical protein
MYHVPACRCSNNSSSIRVGLPRLNTLRDDDLHPGAGWPVGRAGLCGFVLPAAHAKLRLYDWPGQRLPYGMRQGRLTVNNMTVSAQELVQQGGKSLTSVWHESYQCLYDAGVSLEQLVVDCDGAGQLTLSTRLGCLKAQQTCRQQHRHSARVKF